MSVQVVMDGPAEKFFTERVMAVSQALANMEGVRDANIVMQKQNGAGDVEFYTLCADCDATSDEIAVAAMDATLKTISEGLIHVVRRLPEARTEKNYAKDTIHHIASVRASISNQPGERAAPQRGHDGEAYGFGKPEPRGPDVV